MKAGRTTHNGLVRLGKVDHTVFNVEVVGRRHLFEVVQGAHFSYPSPLISAFLASISNSL